MGKSKIVTKLMLVDVRRTSLSIDPCKSST